ncbi:hypothetical protein P3H15_50210 [Rhodococcus sp. T2V]|uniref:alpha/beta hydrolase n=1 Tax=Rhodococcus sp. T2V TaxID=3034164 RepID=UPI0023E2C9ED|nr:hypothetical protein [Rhodococcus sp. T2V]MDF3313096.1 hypothetical protein [Rhodococcus sp. T2V]
MTRQASLSSATRSDIVLGSAERPVPASLWTPADRTARALVLVGHGGYGHRNDNRMTAIADTLVTRHQSAVLLIDGPVHGGRRTDGGQDADTVKREWRTYWHHDPQIDAMVDDWDTALQWARDSVGELPTGYYGLSMGTLYGLPLLARVPTIDAAVLGMWGTDNLTGPRLLVDAAQVSVPVEFYLRLDDHLFARDGQLELFAELASETTLLIGENGRHEPPGGQTTTRLLDALMNELASAKIRS